MVRAIQPSPGGPGWEATVNGKPVTITPFEGVFRSVPVPAGASRVEFRFRSASVRVGLILSAILAVLAIGLLAVGVRQSRAKMSA